MESSSSSNTEEFDKNYSYLLNCNVLIATCQEALQENNIEPDPDGELKSDDFLKPSSRCEHNFDDHHHHHPATQSPVCSVASSGLGNSLEEDCSLKFCHSDEEFSSLNSTTAESYSAQALVAEFIEWLDYVEKTLESLCYCAKVALNGIHIQNQPQLSQLSKHQNVLVANDGGDNQNLHSTMLPDQSHSSICDVNGQPSSANDIEPQLEVVQSSEQFQKDFDAHSQTVEQDLALKKEKNESFGEDCYLENDEAEELMMSFVQLNSATLPIKPTIDEVNLDWRVMLARHKAFHADLETIAYRFLKKVTETREQFSGIGQILLDSLQEQEQRCKHLWIKSLEYCIIIHDSRGQRCPRHYSIKQKLNLQQQPVNTPPSLSVACNYNQSKKFPSYLTLLAHKRHSSSCIAQTSLCRKIELKSIGIGGSSILIQSRRVQTRADGTTMEQEAIIDTHSPDGSGSPSGDSGMFSSSTEKYEIFGKDIGYSSDADMSDAIEAQQHSPDQNGLQRAVRKRQVRRRRTRTARPRPWSYHADNWTDWDYYQTPFYCSGEHMSNDDILKYDNENTIRKLTEFGENYETWINTELDAEEFNKISKPPVVVEKPEIETYCENETVSTVDVSTSPIPFLEMSEITKTKELNLAESKVNSSTQTMVDSASQSVAAESSLQNTTSPCTHCSHVCNMQHANSSSYWSLKFYTSLALAGLFAFLVAVTQSPPDIQMKHHMSPPM